MNKYLLKHHFLVRITNQMLFFKILLLKNKKNVSKIPIKCIFKSKFQGSSTIFSLKFSAQGHSMCNGLSFSSQFI